MPTSFPLARRGLLFVLSSPSGAGKSTIARKLLASDAGLEMSVSATTRPMRPGEVDGKDYHFVDLERFRAMVAAGEFPIASDLSDQTINPRVGDGFIRLDPPVPSSRARRT